MVGNTRGLPEVAWRLGYNTGDNNNKRSINKDNTNVLESLTYTKNNCNDYRGNPSNNNPKYGIAYTGATQKYIKVETPCRNKFKTTQGPWVILPYGRLMQATHKAELHLSPLISTSSKTAHIFPHLKSGALISIGKICDDGCTSTLTANTMKVKKLGEVVLEVTHNGAAGMW